MSYMHNAPWTPSEKVDLLVNVLQSAFPDLPAFLLQIIHEHQVYPKWNDIPLPKGRSLHSSQIAFEEMSRLYRQQGRPHLQQAPMPYTPNPNIAPAIPQQRPFAEPEIHFAQQRALQPRPPRSTDSPVPNVSVTNGEIAPLMRPLAPEPIPEARKKRGRPSKEEVEERDRALAAEGKVYQPKKRATKKFRASTGTPGSEAPPAEASIAPLRVTPSLLGTDRRQPSTERQQLRRTQDSPAMGPYEEERSESQPAHSPTVAQSPSDRLLASHRDRQPSRPTSPGGQAPQAMKEEGREQRL